MKPSRKEITQIVRHLRRTTGRLPDPYQLARNLQTSFVMSDEEWFKVWGSCRSVVREVSGKSVAACPPATPIAKQEQKT